MKKGREAERKEVRKEERRKEGKGRKEKARTSVEGSHNAERRKKLYIKLH